MRNHRWLAWIPMVALLCACGTSDDDDAVDDDTGDDDTAAAPCTFVAPTEWTAAGELPSARESMAVVASVYGVIMIGGWTGSAASDEVALGDVNDGQVQGWGIEPPMPVGLEHHTAELVDGALYVIGGDDGESGRDEVYWVEMTQAMSPWHETTPLPSPRVFHASVAHGSWIYVVGGLQGFSSPQSTVYRGTIGEDHEIDSWVEETALPDARYATSALVHDGHLYVLGGAFSQSTATQSGWRSPIAGDGSLGPWESALNMGDALLSHGTILAGDRVLVTGGLEGWETPSTEVSYAMAKGGPVTWGPAAELPEPRFAHGAVRVGEYALLLGGWEGFNDGIHESIVSARVCEPFDP